MDSQMMAVGIINKQRNEAAGWFGLGNPRNTFVWDGGVGLTWGDYLLIAAQERTFREVSRPPPVQGDLFN